MKQRRPFRTKLMIECCPFCHIDHYRKDLVIVDIDGTLCKHVEPCGDDGFLNAKPLKKRIGLIRHLKEMGHTVMLWTGRPETGRDATEYWLEIYKVPYDILCMEKSGYISIIDDRPVLSNWEYVERNVNDRESKIIKKFKPIK